MNDTSFLGTNISLVKAHNLRAVLLTLLHDQQVSRVELAEKTSLSTTTITNLIDELLQNDIVEEEGVEMVQGPRQVGRPRTALRLVPDARFAVGVHIGIGVLRTAVTNLYANILCSRMSDFNIAAPAEEVLDQIVGEIERCVAESGIDRKKIIGVGIGASGLIDVKEGVCLVAPSLNWRDVPVLEYIQEKLNLLVTVDNNVRCMALGEAFFGIGKNNSPLVFVYGRGGVGAGIVVDGMILRGSAAGAGEIGHLVIKHQGGDLCRCGKRGCLETLISESVLVREAMFIAEENPGSLVYHYLNREDLGKPIDRIFAAARDGDQAIKNMIAERAHYLGIGLSYLVNILDPELILLGGVFAQGKEFILPPAEATMRELAFAGLGEKVRLDATSFGWRAGVIGACALALTTFFYLEPVEI